MRNKKKVTKSIFRKEYFRIQPSHTKVILRQLTIADEIKIILGILYRVNKLELIYQFCYQHRIKIF